MSLFISRLAFADTRWYIADPEVVCVPVAELLAESYATSRVASFDPNVATADVEKGQPTKGSCTVSFQVGLASLNNVCIHDGSLLSWIVQGSK